MSGMGSSLAAGAHPQFRARTTSTKLGRGRGKRSCPGPAACPPPWHSWGVTVLSSFPGAGLEPQHHSPGSSPGRGQGQDGACGPLGCPIGALGLKGTLLPTTMAIQVCWPRRVGTAEAGPGSRALRVGRAMGGVLRGTEAHRLGLRVGSRTGWLYWKLLALSLAQAPPTALPGALLGCATGLTLRENINFGTFLPEGSMQGVKEQHG